MKLLIFSALICSSDTVAAVSIVDYEAQPKLFSCILGEGVFNDIVAITLYTAMLGLQGKEFGLATIILLIEQFFVVAIVSLLIGMFFGCLSTLMFKHMHFLTKSVITETLITYAVAMLSYYVATMTKIFDIEMSGIISILMTGII